MKDIKVFIKKKKKQQNGHQDLPEDEKQKLVEYRKMYHKMRKNVFL